MRRKIEMRRETIKTFAEGYKEFILNCKVRNLSPATIKYYDSVVNYVFYKFVVPDTSISTINEGSINDFILFCREKMNQNDNSINTNIRTLRAVFYYFMRLGYMKEFKIHTIKVNKEIIETYTDEELRILLKKPKISECNYVEYRNWVIVNFLLGTGCRIQTLINIRINDLDFNNDLIVYKHTKNRKHQIVPMSNSLKQTICEYLQYRGEGEYLFVNAYSEKLTATLLNHNLADYNRRRGVFKTGVHRFRHTFAKKWILNGGDIFRLQKILGHSSLEIVKNYVNMFTNDLQKDFNIFNPLEALQSTNRVYIKML